MAGWICRSLGAGVVIVLGLGACGGPSGAECRYANWAGSCVLRSVTRVKIVERFPTTFVVLEGMYEAEGPGAPPPISHQVTAQAENEAELEQFLKAHPRVECRVQEASGAACEHPAVHLALPEFTPSGEAVAESGPEGCAQIETSEVAQQSATKKQITEEFRFEANSAVPGAAAQATADRVVRTILDDPGVQCVALSGQIAFGEKLDLGEQRAEAIQAMLVAGGVDKKRLFIMRNLVPLYAGTPPQERVAMPDHRTVRLSVVVYEVPTATAP